MARKFANERLLAELLPLFDSMEAGLAAAAKADPLREGMELTLRQLHRIAEANGLLEVAPAAGRHLRPRAPPGHEHGRGRARAARAASCRPSRRATC